MEVPGGRISAYSGARIFIARCSNANHGHCQRERTFKGADERAAQGRPLGFLGAWLAAGCDCTGQAHRAKPCVEPRRANRVAFRTWLKELAGTDLGAKEILRCERKKRRGESSEPEMPYD